MNQVKAILCLLLVSLSIACKKESPPINWKAELSKHGAMGEAYEKMIAKKCAGTCQWTRVSTKALRFDGVIQAESYQEFIKKIDAEVEEIILNSVGGSVESALAIATEIKRRNINVTVKGFCISSCANYLFLAGNKKMIDGIVGYHGNAQALHKNACTENSDSRQCQLTKSEKAFFDSIGMSNLLFDVTQSLDKGMQTGLNYAYYAPGKDTLKALGVKGVEGEQKHEFILEMKKLHDEFKLPEFLVATDPNPTISTKLKQI